MLCSRLLAGLRRGWPDTHITLFVREALVDFARLCPDVDEVIGVPVHEGSMVYDTPVAGKYYRWPEQLIEWLKFCRAGNFWRKKFEVALVPRWDIDYYGAIPLAYLLGASERWSINELAITAKTVANNNFECLLTNVIGGQSLQHEVLLNDSILLALGLKPLGKPSLVSWVKELDRKNAADAMRAAGVDFSKKIIVVCLGAGWASKMWPVEFYAQLCATVFNLEAVQLVTFGTAAEKTLGLDFGKSFKNGVVNLEGKLPLNLLPAAVSLGAIYVGSDTGTKHLAAAAGLPVFEVCCHPLSGAPNWAESPRRFGAWAVPHRTVQPEKATAPCEHFCAVEKPHCILGVSVGQAVGALHSLLAETGLQNLGRK